MTGIRVTITDAETGEALEERVLVDDFMVLAEGTMYVDGVQAYPASGTQVVTVKRKRS